MHCTALVLSSSYSSICIIRNFLCYKFIFCLKHNSSCNLYDALHMCSMKHEQGCLCSSYSFCSCSPFGTYSGSILLGMIFDKATKMLISIFADRLLQQAHFNTICYLAPLWFSCDCPGVLKELLCYTPTFLHQQYDNYMLSLHARPSGICHVYLMFDFNFSKHSNQLTSPALK